MFSNIVRERKFGSGIEKSVSALKLGTRKRCRIFILDISIDERGYYKI